MSTAGLVTEYLFTWAGIAPGAGTARPAAIGLDAWGWNYTTILDIIALAAFAGMYWLYRNRERFGAGAGYAKDPVCGMQVQVAHAPATASHDGTTWYFCSDHCQHRFTAGPDRYAGPRPAGHAQHASHAALATSPVEDTATAPVCGMTRLHRDRVRKTVL